MTQTYKRLLKLKWGLQKLKWLIFYCCRKTNHLRYIWTDPLYAKTRVYPRTKQQTHNKGAMVRAQYCSEWTDLGYGMTCMTRLFDSFVPRWLMKAQPLLCVAIQGFGHTHISAWHARPPREATRYATLVDFSCHGQTILSDSNNNVTCSYSRLVLVGWVALVFRCK